MPGPLGVAIERPVDAELVRRRGMAAAGTVRAYERAPQPCSEVGDTPRIFPALRSLRFTEGFETADLKDARGVLGVLASR